MKNGKILGAVVQGSLAGWTQLRALALAAIALSGFMACSDNQSGPAETVATDQAALNGNKDPVVRYWFNEASGTQASDSSGNGYSATLQNGATFVAGARGNAVRIAGGTQRVQLPPNVVQSCDDLTIAARVRLSTNTANWARIFDFGSGTTSNLFLTPRAGAANALRFGITNTGGTGEQQLNYAFTFPTNTWKHVAVTLSGNTGTLYVDGVQVVQNTNMTLNPSTLGMTGNNFLGDSQYAADPTLDGTIDDFLVSCRAYSAAEVAWLANGSDPVAQYAFNETSGTTAADTSGNARHATLANGASFVAGLHGNAVRIAGGTQRVNLPTGIVQSCTDLTIGAHVRLTTNSTNWARIFDIGADTTKYMFLTPRAGATNILRFGITTGGNATEQRLNYTFTFPTNTWKHVAITISGTTGRMYVDGVQVATNTSMTLDPSALGATVNNWLGDSQFAADPTLDGTVDNLFISCRAFSAAEIGTMAGACTSAANCNDGNPCTTDACSSGFCTHANAADGTSCLDGDLCNGSETCQFGFCSAGTPPLVDDGNACTTDACSPTQGVTHTPITGGACGGGGGSGGLGGASGSSGAGGTSAGGSSGTGGSGGVTCPSGTTPVEMFIELAPGVARNQVVLGSYGVSPLEIHDRVRLLVTPTTFASASSLSSNPSIPTRLGVEAHVQDLWAEPNLELRDRSRVHGNAVSPGTITLFPDAVVNGQKLQQELTPHRRESWIICHPNTHQGNIDVQPGQAFPANGTRLAPGAWGTLAVKTGARIRLRGATTYFFESIAIEPGAIVNLDTAAGGTQLYFRSGGFFRGTQERTDTRPNVLFGSENGDFLINGSFRGTVVAPRGLVNLPTASGGHKGSFFGRLVIAHQSTDITQEPVNTTGMCPANAACNGLCPCTGGGGGRGQCQTDGDCQSGQFCTPNNGACFGEARSKRFCWPAQCLDGIDPEAGECGQADSPCGSVCGCAKPCNLEDLVNTCPEGEVCTPKLGRAVGIHSRDACGPSGPNGPICPSNDPALSGDDTKICGRNRVCTPNCSAATPLNPSDGCGGLCAEVCPIGLKGCCSQDLECKDGGACLMDPDGQRTCRPFGCANRPLKPPLCGTPSASCGAECPHCTPRCEGRECGLDPNCGESCGSCGSGEWCDAAGQCRTPTSDPPIGGVPDLPSTPAAAVGPVPGAFSVTDQGTAQYTIPIDVPPGRLGMTPALSLVYQATRDNGTLGVGWRIDGLSKIARCPKNFAVDGYAAAVKNDSTDALCLDGKRLVAIANAGASGGNGTEYRTLIDSFTKIVSRQDESGAGVQPDARSGTGAPVVRSEQGPDSFEVRTKDGRIMTFGGTIDSLVIRPNGVRQTWLLRKIEDRTGNNILYSYDNAGSHVISPLADGRVPTRLHPTLISYTGRGESPGNRQVQFTYETRPDPSLRFLQGGVAWTLDDRLARITTYVEDRDAQQGAQMNAVKNYRLSYLATDFSSIEKITECEGDGDAHCKPPTKFTYLIGPDVGFTGPAPGTLGAEVVPGGQLDVNGDGFPDFFDTTIDVDVEGVDADPDLVAAQVATDIVVDIAANVALPEAGYFISTLWSDALGPAFFGMFADEPEVKVTIQDNLQINPQERRQRFPQTQPHLPCPGANVFLDYDRDGRDDVITDCGLNKVSVNFSNGNGTFTRSPNLSLPLGPPPASRLHGDSTRTRVVRDSSFGPSQLFYDIDGDSLQDIVSCRDECTIELRRRLNPSGDFDTPVQLRSPTCNINCATGNCQFDGEAEPFCASEIADPAGISKDTKTIKPTRTVAMFDIDGDGAPDLLNAVPSRQGTLPPTWRVLRHKVSGGVHSIEWQPVEFPNVDFVSSGDRLQVADFNNDGLADVLNVDPGRKATIWLNTGGGAFLTKEMPHKINEDYFLNRVAVTDYNGDGRTDWIEGWGRKAHPPSCPFLQQCPSCFQSKITLMAPDSDQSALAVTFDPPDLQFLLGTDTCNFPLPVPFQMATDFDADGAIDILSSTKIFYGGNSHRMLISQIEDGLGNVTRVTYDGPGTYTNTCASSTWPEMCLKQMTGLVSHHAEFTVAGGVSVERTYDYTYTNARMSTTGHGWLGFEKRTVEFQRRPPPGTVTTPPNPPDNEFDPTMTTVEMEPVARYPLANGYVYPLAGLPKTIIVERTKNQTPIESNTWRRRTRTENTWQVGVSAAGLPFPKVEDRTTNVFEAPITTPPTSDGLLLTGCEESLRTDPYGNTTFQRQVCDDDATQTDTTFAPDPETWIIANPELVTITSRHSNSPNVSESWDPAYYPNGLLLSVTRSPDAPGSAFHTTTYVRNPFGNVQTIVENATGEPQRATDITYDVDNVFPSSITNAKGHTTQIHFDRRWGVPITVVDPNGIVARQSYDGLGLLAETQDPGGTTLYTYESIGLLAIGQVPGLPFLPPDQGIQVTVQRQGVDGTPAGFVSTVLDSLGRPVRTTSPGLGGVLVEQHQRYDQRGRLIFATLPTATGSSGATPITSYSYDGFDRLKRIARSDESVAETQYASIVSVASEHAHWFRELSCVDGTSGFGCPIEAKLTKDEEGNRNVLLTEQKGLIVRNIDGENVDTTARFSSYRYGAFARLEEMAQNERTVRVAVPDDGPHTFFNYDAYGRLLTHTDPDSGNTTYTYNGYDQLKTSRDPKNQLRTFDYDILGRVITITDPAGTTEWIHDQGPNGLGRITETHSPPTAEAPFGQRLIYNYEAPVAGERNRGLLQRLDYVLDSTPYPVGFTYDDLGRTKTIAYPDLGSGPPVVAEYTYDGSGFLTNLQEVGSGTTNPIWHLDSAFEGQLVEHETFGNNVTTEYAYTPERRFLETIKTTFGNSTLQDLGYSHYQNGLVFDSIKAGTERRAYTYDALNRLLTTADGPPGAETVTTSHEYDHLGNLTKRGPTTLTYASNMPHLLTSVGSNNGYGYDLNGNVRQRQGPDIPGGIQTFDYTPFDLPSAITTGQGQGTKTSKFEYSADEERLVRRETGPGIDKTRHFVTDLYQRLVDNIAGSTTEERFRLYAGSREVAQIVRENGVDKTLFFHADNLGTPETITTSDGDVSHVDLDPWGKETPTGASEVTRVGFTGHEHDRDLGLVDMKGRIYDPLAGRFTTQDPVMQAPFWSQGLNRYAYVFNDPVNNTDPSGFEITIQANTPGLFIDLDAGPTIDFDHAAAATGSSSSAGAGAGSSGASAGGGGAALGSVLGMGGSIANTIAHVLGGGLPGQKSTPSSHSQSRSSSGSQAATSTPPRTGGDAASAKNPVKAPTSNPDWGRPVPGAADAAAAHAPQPAVGNDLLSDAARQIPDTHETWEKSLAVVLSVTGAGEVAFEIGVAIKTVQLVRSFAAIEAAAAAAGPLKNASGPLEQAAFRARVTNNAPSVVDPNRLNHIFGPARHNLGGLVEKYGSQHGAFEALQNATQAAVRNQGSTGVFETSVSVGGFNVTVRGAVVDGVARIGTAFVP